MCDRCAMIARGDRSAIIRSDIIRMGGRSASAPMGDRSAIVITPLSSMGVIVSQGDRSAIDKVGVRTLDELPLDVATAWIDRIETKLSKKS